MEEGSGQNPPQAGASLFHLGHGIHEAAIAYVRTMVAVLDNSFESARRQVLCLFSFHARANRYTRPTILRAEYLFFSRSR